MIYAQARSFRFTYPALYKWLFGVATLGWSLLFWLSYRAHGHTVDLQGALLLAFALASLYTCWRTWAWVTVDDQTLTLQQLGRSRRVRFDEITSVEHLGPEHMLIIEGNGCKIYIKKQLEGYGLFYNVVAGRFPSAAIRYSPFLPLQVHTRRGLLLRPWLFIAAGLGLAALAVWRPVHLGLLQAVALAALGFVALVAGAYFAWTMPRGYTFGRDQLTVHYLLRRQVYPAAELQDMALVTHSDNRLETSCLRLEFAGGSVILRDQSVDYPPEELVRAIKLYYVPRAAGRAW
jgi:hypothetical protein